MSLADLSFLLFVPGDRPDRFETAAGSGASGIILDLEDAVAADRKTFARDSVARYLDGNADPSRTVVRINAVHSPWWNEDIAMLRTHRIGALMIPKVGNASVLDSVVRTLHPIDIIALTESASGILHAEEIIAHPHCMALAFGPFDLAADLGSADEWDVMLPYRSRVLLAVRSHGKLALDGPSLSFSNAAHMESEARAVLRLGYDGKLLIHPAQIAPTRKAFMPTPAQVYRASRIIEAGKHAMPAVVDGLMIDEPLIIAAQRILERARACTP
jgi:citrate lyase subunit beta/citryl-CoA lyase